MGEIAALTLDETEGLTDPDVVPDAPDAPVTVLGDVWLLGAEWECSECPADVQLCRRSTFQRRRVSLWQGLSFVHSTA